MHICFLLKFKSATNNDKDIASGIIAVNNFSAHWIKEIDFKRYGDDISILPHTNTVDTYRYSGELLKHIPEDALKTLENTLLYSKKNYSRK